MAVWLTRAGRHGEDEATALENGIAIIGWGDVSDLSKIESHEAMRVHYSSFFPAAGPKAVINHAAQLWAFAKRIEESDLIILPLKTRSEIAIGIAKGPYEYRNGRHTRGVTWSKIVPRNTFGQDLLYSFGAFMTVCQIDRNSAESRIRSVLNTGTDPHRKGIITSPRELNASDVQDAILENESNIEELATDQIRQLIEAKFKGHSLTRLVEAILNTFGYKTFLSPPGADGGVDIRAAKGVLGFDSDNLYVQVKSGESSTDIQLREFEGVMRRAGVDKGLFVSWNGFSSSLMKNEGEHFFRVRLWSRDELVRSILENYDKLPDEIQTEIPLKRIWVVVPQE